MSHCIISKRKIYWKTVKSLTWDGYNDLMILYKFTSDTDVRFCHPYIFCVKEKSLKKESGIDGKKYKPFFLLQNLVLIFLIYFAESASSMSMLNATFTNKINLGTKCPRKIVVSSPTHSLSTAQ